MSHRILIVDDDRPILELVGELLAEAGYDVRATTDAVQALRWIDAEAFELVVLDMRMPVLDGWQFKQALDERGFDVPVVVMTAAQDARRWAREIDAAGYLAKPFDIDDLLRVVAATLEPDRGTDGASFGGHLRSVQPRLGRLGPLPDLRPLGRTFGLT